MLQEADFDHRQFQPQAGDEKLYVRFYKDVIADQTKTKEEGRPIFKEVTFVMIQAPGDLLKCIKRPMRPGMDDVRFPKQWQAFSAGQDQEVTSGTPLAQWPMITRAQAEELAYFKIKTVEQLAGVADNLLQKYMGLQTLKQRAKDWLGRAENSKEIVQLRDANTELTQQVAELQAAVRDLSSKLQGHSARK